MLVGGNLEWLADGLKKVDPLIALFAELNEYMAYKPWAVQSSLLEKMMKGDEQENRVNARQLLSGALVLARFHGLCSLV